MFCDGVDPSARAQTGGSCRDMTKYLAIKSVDRKRTPTRRRDVTKLSIERIRAIKSSDVNAFNSRQHILIVCADV